GSSVGKTEKRVALSVYAGGPKETVLCRKLKYSNSGGRRCRACRNGKHRVKRMVLVRARPQIRRRWRTTKKSLDATQTATFCSIATRIVQSEAHGTGQDTSGFSTPISNN
ncbi:unnamed protein product, partial [Ectocarpus sp. 12 AP-2014]